MSGKVFQGEETGSGIRRTNAGKEASTTLSKLLLFGAEGKDPPYPEEMKQSGLPLIAGSGIEEGKEVNATAVTPTVKPSSRGSVVLKGAKGNVIPDGRVPAGWRRVPSRSRPGKFSYENMHTGERIAWLPTEPASKLTGEILEKKLRQKVSKLMHLHLRQKVTYPFRYECNCSPV